ncbi:MAG: saccharopine dehydrogenase NADP-binding domain-containing protein [Alphaproteobacteria bacterium]
MYQLFIPFRPLRSYLAQLAFFGVKSRFFGLLPADGLANHAMDKLMTMRVLILGGYGNFGSYVARALKDDPAITLIIAGRSLAKAQAFVAGLGGANPAEAAALDIGGDLAEPLAALRPGLVIHTVGPFQHQSYAVA